MAEILSDNWHLYPPLSRPSFMVYTYLQLGKNCDPPQEFDAKGESTLTTRLHDTLNVP